MFDRLLAGDTAGGALACLIAAGIWAVSVTLFARSIRKFGAAEVNLAKTAIASVLLGLTTLAAGQLDALRTASMSAVAIIALSGVVGMAFGDTALFAAVDRIGVHRTMLVHSFAPVFAAVGSFVLSGETLSTRQGLGAVVTLAGVAIVIGERTGEPTGEPADRVGERSSLRRSATTLGVLFGVAAAAGQGFGVVLAKIGMEEVGFLPASFLRLSVACVALAALQAVRLGVVSALSILRRGVFSAAGFRWILPPAFLGSYIAILFMMLGISLAPAAVAAVLLGTTPIFSLFVEARVLKRPVTMAGLVGTLIAVAGIAVLSTA